jgi:hypothetical protein
MKLGYILKLCILFRYEFEAASFSIIPSINCFILCKLSSKKEITSMSGAYLKLVIGGIESSPIDLATLTFKKFLCVPIFLSLFKQYNQSVPSTVGFNRDCKSLCSLLNFSVIFFRLISYGRRVQTQTFHSYGTATHLKLQSGGIIRIQFHLPI